MSRRVASTERIGNLRVLEPRTQESYALGQFRVNGQTWVPASAPTQLACGVGFSISPQRLSQIHASRSSTTARKVDDGQSVPEEIVAETLLEWGS